MARIIVDGMRVSGRGANLDALDKTGKGLWRGTWPKKKPPRRTGLGPGATGHGPITKNNCLLNL